MPIIVEIAKDACTEYFHKEERPRADDYGAGTIWRCSHCNREYIVTDGSQREPNKFWQFHYR